MTWNTRYLPPDFILWQGRADLPPDASFFQIIKMLNVLDETLPTIKHPAFALVGFRCDEGIRRNFGRVGAAEGPIAIREVLAKLPVHRQPLECFDAGDISCLDGDLEAAQHALGELIALLLQQGLIPIVLGGGHELALGHYQGIEAVFPQQNLGIINFDAHFDMRTLLPHDKGSSGTPFLQIAKMHEITRRRFDYNCIGIQQLGNIHALFETAKRYDVKVMLADELHQDQKEKCIDFVKRVVDQNEMVYVSICLDVFAAAFAPGVSAIQPLGLFPWHVVPLLRQLAASGKVVSYDLAELSPRYDSHLTTTKLAAHLVSDIIHHHEGPRTEQPTGSGYIYKK